MLVEKFPKYFVLAFLAAGAAMAIWQFAGSGTNAGRTVTVKIPKFSEVALAGKGLFEENCAACHGQNASGTKRGPPLVHDIYNPRHHADEAFFFAAKFGVRQHHWPYGNMPPQSHVTEEQLGKIVRYIRELQTANGISYRPHNM